MSEETAFLQQLQADPRDDDTRRVYADWLEEHGDERGSFLRLELELASPTADPDRLVDAHEEWRLLHEKLDTQWVLEAGKRYDVVLHRYPPDRKINLIKAIREITRIGLKDAKDLSEALPATVQAGVPRAWAEDAFAHLRACGPSAGISVEVEMRPSQAVPPRGWPRSVPGEYQVWLTQVADGQEEATVQAVCDLLGLPRSTCRAIVESAPYFLKSFPTQADADRAGAAFPDPAALEVRALAPRECWRVAPLDASGSWPFGSPVPVGSRVAAGEARFDVQLAGYTPIQKIAVIKVLRELTGLGLKEAKDLSEAPRPIAVLRGVDGPRAEEARRRLEEVAAVQVRPAS